MTYFSSRLCVAVVLTAPALASAQTYTITDLGSLPDRASSMATAVNDSGQVAGYGSGHGGQADARAFFLNAPQGGGLRDLGVLGGRYSYAWALNNAGQVAGYADDPAGYNRAFLSEPHGGPLHDLGTLPNGISSEAYAVNDSGQVAGIALDAGRTEHAFLYSAAGGMQDLGFLPGGTYSDAFAVNAYGQVAGQGDDAAGKTHAFLYSAAGGMRDIGALPGSNILWCAAINKAGQVAGYSDAVDHRLRLHAFLSGPNGGLLQDIGTLGGDYSESWALGLNDAGQVVGTSDGHAFLYSADRGMRDLNTVVFGLGNTDWTLNEATGVSNTGFITGTGKIHGQTHAFLLTPSTVPEPASMAALGLGALGLLKRRRKA